MDQLQSLSQSLDEGAPDTRRALVSLSDGVEGIRQTLAIMRRLVRESRTDENVRAQAEKIIAGIPGKNFYAQAKAVHEWMQRNIKYVLDPDGVERVCGPQYTLKTRSGDCDDQVTLESALLIAIGHPVRMVAVAFEPDAFTHVYLRTLVGDRWIASDPTEPNPFGWEPGSDPKMPAVSRIVRDI